MGRLYLWLLSVPLLAQVVPDQFIVELSEEPALVSAMRAGGRRNLDQHRERVRRAQQGIRTRLAQRGRVLGTLETVANAVIVEAPGLSAAELSALPGVRKVYPVHELRLDLDRVLPQHKVPEAWNQVGGSARAGAGIKIGIIDSGIDVTHPGFQDPTLSAPEGFPKLDRQEWTAASTSKVIVVRSYEQFLRIDPPTPEDRGGHGTAVAMVAAGVANNGPLARISGVAPAAYLGSYKIFGGPLGNRGSTAGELKAIDDAVADGMDVLNLSLGSHPAQRPEDDIEVQALERVSAAGVLVVKSAGNEGPAPGWISSPGTGPTMITVGAAPSDREFGSAVEVGNGSIFAARSGDNSASSPPVGADLFDAANVEKSGFVCGQLPDGSLEGVLALILRGGCFFEEKANYAKAAGALGVVIYTDEARPDAITMALGSAMLPALMVSNQDGLALKALLAEGNRLRANLYFNNKAISKDASGIAEFSSRGPNPNLEIKPDLVATGEDVYTAAQKEVRGGAVYSPSGYAVENGTSFSAPVVAGAAAVLKSARPGLNVLQYRSLLINSSTPVTLADGSMAPVQHSGAGRLNLDAALKSTIALAPVSLSFGAGGGTVSAVKDLWITNLGSTADTFTFEVQPFSPGPAPVVQAERIALQPGKSGVVEVRMQASDLAPGEYQGFVVTRGATSDVVARAPYWYAVADSRIAYLSVFAPPTSPAPGALATLYIRTADKSGVPFNQITPLVTSVEGGGTVLRVTASRLGVAGLYDATVRASDRPNQSMTFRVDAGGLVREVTISTSTGSP